MLHLEIVTPEKKVFSDKVQDVYLPGEDGEMGILELHAALVTSLKPGELRYKQDGQVTELAIGTGFAEVTQEKVVVLTDLAKDAGSIDEDVVKKALEAAEKALETIDYTDVEERRFQQAIIERSIAQMQLKARRGK